MSSATPTSDSTQGPFACALLEPELAAPAGIITHNGSDPARRFDVYRNNVVVSLIGAMADTFPVVRELVGADFFAAMAGVFVRTAPPQSRVLAEYGDEFPAFLADFGPTRRLPYLPDIARLEWARVRAYHAADDSSIDAGALRALAAHGVAAGRARVVLRDSVSVVSSAFAIVALWAAHHEAVDIESIEIDAPESALVVRPGADVLVVPITPAQGVFFARLAAGAMLHRAADAATTCGREFELPATIALALSVGAFAAIQD